MPRLEDYYRLIASIISPFEKVLDPSYASVDWERFVYISSSYLMLPPIYCQILKKGWSEHFPKELLTYLEAVTAENRRRNEEISHQMKRLSGLFDAAGIKCVFLKGTAMLAGGYYEDIAERMLSDIDILVDVQDSISAYKCLEELGYDRLPTKAFQKPFSECTNDKHLPRLVHPDEIAAVEIHNRLNRSSHKERLKAQTVLSRSVEAAHGLFIPHPSDLLLHTVYNWHINDLGGTRLAISFRSAYDMLLLLERFPSLQTLQREQPIVRKFSALISPFFPVLPQQRTWRQSLFLLKLRYPMPRKAWDIFILEAVSLPVRLRLFLRFSEYRYRVFQVIAWKIRGLMPKGRGHRERND